MGAAGPYLRPHTTGMRSDSDNHRCLSDGLISACRSEAAPLLRQHLRGVHRFRLAASEQGHPIAVSSCRAPQTGGRNVLIWVVPWNRYGLVALSLSHIGATVSDQNEYRENAAECSRMADIAMDVRDKQTWVEMAAHWRRLLKPIGSLPPTPFPAGQLPVQPPVCLACQKPMKYLRTYPDIKNPSLDEHFYRCVCGEKQSILEPR
jgi:hypothetical protein